MKPPIYTGVKKYISKQRVLFTTPGHNGKVILNSKNFCRLDAASSFETDTLDTPKGYILDSEYQLMKMYKTSHSYYITNGTSCGIMAMIGSVLRPGDKIIVDRCCHKSVIDAIMLNRLIPVFVQRHYNTELGIFCGIDTYALETTLAANSDAKAIFITTPTYYGVVSDIEEIAELAYKYNMLLLTDESHGAHLPFADDLPPSSIKCGADMVLHNAGETLGSMSGGVILHVNNDTIDLNRVRSTVYTYQSPDTSNAYLCALENSIYYAQSKSKRYTKLKHEIERCSTLINDGTDIVWLTEDNLGNYADDTVDPTRIVLNFAKIGITAQEAAEFMRSKSIEPEAAIGYNVVLVASLFNSSHDIRKLMTTIMAIYKQFLKKHIEPLTPEPAIPDINTDVTLACAPSGTMSAASDIVPPNAVTGRISKSCVYACPMYVPLIIPGERINEMHLADIERFTANGGYIGGLTSGGDFEVADISSAYGI